MTTPRRRNAVPDKYRGVAVSRVSFRPTAQALTDHLMGKPAYRRSRFVVALHGDEAAVARIQRDRTEELFAPITGVEILSTPETTAFIEDPDCDTAIPSALAHTAVSRAPHAEAVAILGKYQHISFIIGAEPLRITVREIAPPEPAKLLDQARRVLDTAEDIPPIELVPDIVNLNDLAAEHPAAHYLVPCRGSGLEIPGSSTSYLDERPEYAPWLLLGPERSQQIHQAFYDVGPDQYIDICPDNRPPIDGPLLTKCSLLENELRVDEGQVVVPWGSTLAQVEKALRILVDYWKPAWEPV